MFHRLKDGFARFMYGRYGTDKLNMALLILGVVLTLLGSITNLYALGVLAYLPLIAVFVWQLVSLFMNAALTDVARGGQEGAFSRMNFGRVCLTVVLAALAVPPTWGLTLLLDLINTQWLTLMNWALASTLHIVLSGAAVALGLLVILLVYSVIGVFSRQMTLYMADSAQPVRASTIGRSFLNALRCAFAPTGLFLSALGWFILLLIFMLALTLAACWVIAPPLLDMGLQMVVLQLVTALMTLPAWAGSAIIIFGGLWGLGLGLVFWPRYGMTRLYYYRLVMRDTGVM